MTQLGLDLAPPTSLVGKLAAYFQCHANTWIDGRALGTIAGSYAWRSRCAELRFPPFNMRIENRQTRMRTDTGRFTISEYRYLP